MTWCILDFCKSIIFTCWDYVSLYNQIDQAY